MLNQDARAQGKWINPIYHATCFRRLFTTTDVEAENIMTEAISKMLAVRYIAITSRPNLPVQSENWEPDL